jgi:hypothetical protein
MTYSAQPIAAHHEDRDAARTIAAPTQPSIGPVRQLLRAVAAWCVASPASTYVFTPPPHENATARAARIKRDQQKVNEVFAPPDPYDTWRRLW